MEESGLLQLPLFRPDVLSLLELLSHIPILLSPSHHLHLLSLLLLLLAQGFKFDHAFVGRLQLDGLRPLSLRFAILRLLSKLRCL